MVPCPDINVRGLPKVWGVALLMYGGVDFQYFGHRQIWDVHYKVKSFSFIFSIHLQEISSAQTIWMVNPCQHNNLHMYYLPFQTYDVPKFNLH